MNAKEYLSQAFRLDQRINNKLEQLAVLKEVTKRATGSVRAKQMCGSIHSPMEDTVIRVIDLQHEIDDEIDRFVDLKREIKTAISELHQPEYQMVLELRYLLYKRWDEIAEIMKLSLERTHCIHGKALLAIKVDGATNSATARNERIAT